MACQSSLSPYESQVTCGDFLAIIGDVPKEWMERLLDQSSNVTLDIDAFEYTVYGIHKICRICCFYQNYCFPGFISHAKTNEFLSDWLEPGAVHSSLGAEGDLESVTMRFLTGF